MNNVENVDVSVMRLAQVHRQEVLLLVLRLFEVAHKLLRSCECHLAAVLEHGHLFL